MLWESCVKEKRYDEHGLDVFEGNTGTDNSQSALTEENALRMIGLAGGRREFEGFVTKMASTFGATIPETTFSTIAKAGRRFNQAFGARMLSYKAA